MTWNEHERREVRSVVLDIAAASPPAVEFHDRLILSAADAATLVEGVFVPRSNNPLNYVPIRHVYRSLRFDETRPFSWRLEHKLIQALVLNHFVPGIVPATSGTRAYLNRLPVRTETSIRSELKGKHVKRALGSGSTADDTVEREEAIASYINHHHRGGNTSILDEAWVVQERLSIAREYRVHTIENVVVPDLTFARHSNEPLRTEREATNAFVESVVDVLPPTLLAQTICGWDVCRTASGEYMVIEVNFGGAHPFEQRGFQCSGMLATTPWGPYLVARLTRFIEKHYGVGMRWDAADVGLGYISTLYDWIDRWHKLLNALSSINCLEVSPPYLEVAQSSDEFDESRKVLDDLVKRIGRISAAIL